MTKKKECIILVLCLLFFCIFGLNPENYTTGMEGYIIEKLGLGIVHITSGDMVILVSAMFPVILVEIVEGINIYKHYTMGSVYYFVRQKDLKLWYRKEAQKLFVIIFKIFFSYLALGYVLGCIIFNSGPDFATICMVLCQCAVFVVYTYTFTLLINYLSIIMGTDSAYVLGIGAQLMLVMMLLFFEGKEDVLWNNLFFRMNPVTCMVMVWHYIPGIDTKAINELRLDFDVLCSVMILSVFAFVVHIVGEKVIVKRDIAMENKEEEG